MSAAKTASRKTVERILRLCRKEAAASSAWPRGFSSRRSSPTGWQRWTPTKIRPSAPTPSRPVVEMLDRAERVELIDSADEFPAASKRRNRLVHQYVEDSNEPAANLRAVQAFLPKRTAVLDNVELAITRLLQRPSQ